MRSSRRTMNHHHQARTNVDAQNVECMHLYLTFLLSDLTEWIGFSIFYYFFREIYSQSAGSNQGAVQY